MRKALLLLGALAVASASSAADLDALRDAYAMHYLDPVAHLQLAKALYERGDRLTAFLVSEVARRERFEEAVFNAAFAKVFHPEDDFDNSPAAEQALAAKLQASPSDSKLLVKLADVYISRSDWAHARPLLQRAIAADETAATPVYALAELEKRDGHAEKGSALEAAFEAAHPESRDVLTGKIDAAIESDPATAKPLVATALEKYPNDGWLHFQAGRVAQKTGDEVGAAAEYRRAAKLAPGNDTVQGWTARYLYKVMNQPDEALERYIDAYFINPHFYETEYAESRIRTIASARAAAKLAGLDRAALIPSLRDSDPIVAGQALEALGNAWTPEAAKPVAALLRHDDPVLRAIAADLLGKKADATFDDTLTQLLADSDARVRGFAAYLAVQRWGKRGIEVIRPWLDSPYELVRFDTMSALLEHGGKEGKAIVEAYLKSGKEKSAAMRDIFTRAASS